MPGYLDGEIDSLLSAELEHRLDEYVNCRIVVDTLRKTILLYRDYDREPAPPEMHARLICILNLNEPQIQHEREATVARQADLHRGSDRSMSVRMADTFK